MAFLAEHCPTLVQMGRTWGWLDGNLGAIPLHCLYNVQCTLYKKCHSCALSVQCTVHKKCHSCTLSVQCTVHKKCHSCTLSVQWTVYSGQCTRSDILYTVCTVNSVQWTVYKKYYSCTLSVQWTVYSGQCTKSTIPVHCLYSTTKGLLRRNFYIRNWRLWVPRLILALVRITIALQ